MARKPATGRAGGGKEPAFGPVVITGLDPFLVHREAQRLIDEWVPADQREFGLEVVDGEATRVGDALQSLSRLTEALQTISWFAPLKVVWWKDTNLLGEGRIAQAASVKDELDRTLDALRSGLGEKLRLIVTALEISRRVRFTKGLLELPGVRSLEVGMGDRGRGVGPNEVRQFIVERLAAAGCEADSAALTAMAETLGTDMARVASEVDKLVAYIGGSGRIDVESVRAICSPGAENQAWDLTDAFGERQLTRALQVLGRLLFQGETPIGLLYALVSRARLLLVARGLVDRDVLTPTEDYRRFQAQLGAVPEAVRGALPQDRARNPLLQHPYVAFRLAQQARKHTPGGLARTLAVLRDANRELVTTAVDPRLVLERALVRIVPPERPAGPRRESRAGR